MLPREILTKEFLEEYYVEKHMSILEIAKMAGIKSTNSVTQFIKKFNLHRRSKNDFSHILTKEYLIENYVNLKKSVNVIAFEVGTSKSALKRYMNKFDIPYRSPSERTPREMNVGKSKWYKEISSKYWSNLKHGALYRNFSFEISMEYAWSLFEKQKGLCALSGVEIEFHKSGNHRSQQTASLDRIDSSKGYLEGNVQWIHKAIQSMKMNKQDKDLIYWANKIAKTHPRED